MQSVAANRSGGWSGESVTRPDGPQPHGQLQSGGEPQGGAALGRNGTDPASASEAAGRRLWRWLVRSRIVRSLRVRILLAIFLASVLPLIGTLWYLLAMAGPQLHDESLRQLSREAIGAGVLALIVSLLLASLLSHVLIGPLGRMTRSAQAIASGAGESMPQLHSTIELEDLSRSLNQMVANLTGMTRTTQHLMAALQARNAELEQITRNKSLFLANMSHELRTPLNGIIGFAELMFQQRAGPVSPQHREYLGYMLNSAEHLLNLINEVLDLAKVEAGRLEFRPEQVDLAVLLREVTHTLESLSLAKKLRLEVAVDPQLGEVMIDRGKLKQVLYNYLSNAYKFTPENGRVTIRIGREDDRFFRLEVEDTGRGIQQADLNRLFQEFEQVDTHSFKGYAGTGLGLALTKRIVEAQGGRVGVRSVPEVGSVFFALLPLARPPANAPPSSSGLETPALQRESGPAAPDGAQPQPVRRKRVSPTRAAQSQDKLTA